MKRILAPIACSLALLLLSGLSSSAQLPSSAPPFVEYMHHPWVDSVFKKLNADERIAQLIMVAAYSNRGDDHEREILKFIREQKIGGLIFFQGGPVRQAKLI